MKRSDYNLLAEVLRSSIESGMAQPRIALEVAGAFSKRGDSPPEFRAQDFINRCVPARHRSILGKVNPGHTPPSKEEAPLVLVEADASMFYAILMVEFPAAKELVGCAFSPVQSAKFSIGRIGSKVWIKFGGQATIDPVGAVRAAAPDAIQMALGQISAKEVRG